MEEPYDVCLEDVLIVDGFTQCFKFASKPPESAKWRPTPSIEDSDYSSSTPIVAAHAIDEEDDATLPAIASLHQDAASGCSNILTNDSQERLDTLCLHSILVI